MKHNMIAIGWAALIVGLLALGFSAVYNKLCPYCSSYYAVLGITYGGIGVGVFLLLAGFMTKDRL
ncbi:hypothetical protein JW968_05490 [Candidatus Woesearchaeota archaeon]|nr:hypothetical protein [Candidatus Woesearchaeota archaeon]